MYTLICMYTQLLSLYPYSSCIYTFRLVSPCTTCLCEPMYICTIRRLLYVCTCRYVLFVCTCRRVLSMIICRCAQVCKYMPAAICICSVCMHMQAYTVCVHMYTSRGMYTHADMFCTCVHTIMSYLYVRADKLCAERGHVYLIIQLLLSVDCYQKDALYE